MARPTPTELGKKGWEASGDKWIRLISKALSDRGIAPHFKYVEGIVTHVFQNNRKVGGNIGWQTIDSEVGRLQATGWIAQEFGVPIKSHKIEFHRDRVNLSAPGAPTKPFDEAVVFGKKRVSSTSGTKLIRSKWNK